ncbi:DUF4394 domain-containing protein [Hymenobacter sp. BT175]|uniref:DUF4394 domain-containing protein n=1 Tax=Hymenobacter translucens TaxID=2886507 RepID=UPI001D0F2062|nr:DUF4394 domain-containing protein [Hymenobacter translucens]MCC2547075.1 DUF4394 domain-containing protein [Hymenobacter translucens]
MSTTSTRWTTALKSIVVGTILAGAASLPAAAQTVYGLSATLGATPGSLVTFDATNPGVLTATVAITGRGAGQTLVGLDSRPNTGELFVLGYNFTDIQVQLYTLNPTTGVLTAVGPLQPLNLGNNFNRIGFDFNPTVDRIRVTGSNNTNFRLNPNNGAVIVDGNLAYAATDANAGQTPGIGAVAYANSFIGATTTVLYDIDEANSRYTVQNPPNDGILNSRTAFGRNLFGIATDLDIYFNPTTRTNSAYLTMAQNPPGMPPAMPTQLYTLDFMTGAGLTLVGNVGPAGTIVTDIAFAISRPATLPAITGQLAYALGGTNLLTFDTAQPGLIRTATGITGIPADQTLVGIDVRPATNVLYGLGYRAADQMATVYTLNATTGVATPVGPAVMLPLGTAATDVIGFDFNPTVDRIRVTSSNRANFRLVPTTGAIAATDTQLAYAATDANAAATPAIATVAYTNSFMGATATSGTTLYDYDRTLNILATQVPPNDGTLNTLGSSGLTLNATMPSVSLDIYSPAAGTNTAYLVTNSAASANSSLYTLNLTNGATTLVGAIGQGSAVRDIAVAAATGVVTGTRRAELATLEMSVYPNPATNQATVAFRLEKSARVDVTVFDALGRQVEVVRAGMLPAGAQQVRWNARGHAGLYFLHLSIDGQPAGVRQTIVLK